MESFPAVDPIPLPAPVWLFKALNIVTLSLHFASLSLLIGGLAAALLLSIRGRRNAPAYLNAAGAVTHRLPIVMTFVINLGVPPLLFTQVLYGRALYTSSVLIGALWISVIVLIMAAYTCLYIIAKRAETGRPWTWIGLLALLLILGVGRIYSMNMTLMLRPEVWLEMYRTNPAGVSFPMGDPTVTPRWLYMMLGSLLFGGAGFLALALKPSLGEGAADALRRWGRKMVASGAALLLVLGLWVHLAQPAPVRSAVWSSPAYWVFMPLWALTLLVAGHLAVRGLKALESRAWALPVTTSAVAFINILSMVVCRDTIRDASLRAHGFDVWARQVAANWHVVGLFLILFVAAGALVGWMALVTVRAKGGREDYV